MSSGTHRDPRAGGLQMFLSPLAAYTTPPTW